MYGKKILIVEDQPNVRDLCVKTLRAHGFDSIVANNGLEGITAYREGVDEIDLVLSDISMPFMNGIEMIRNIFAVAGDAKVILMSGHNLSEVLPADLFRLCAVLEKPFTSARLVSRAG
jgi:two-component system cell cycle sensor histidine kinase/response regulator CckA